MRLIPAIVALSLLPAIGHAQMTTLGAGSSKIVGGGSSPTAIFAPSAAPLNADDSNSTVSFRVIGTTSGASLGSLRATISASSTTGLTATHVSVCKWDGSGSSCTTVPVELTTSCPGNTAGSGFAISAGQSCTTNFVNHSATFSIAPGDGITVVVDTGTPSGNLFRGSQSNATTWFSSPGQASWNVQSPGAPLGFAIIANTDYMISSVETQ